MELETVVSLSRTELLREVIIEKLTVAAQQIFAVVERTVAAYEEEASGFRKEIERHRRQLEVVLQPEIKVEITDDQLFPVCELGQAEAPEGGRERAGAEEQHKYEPSVGFICYAEEQMTEDEGDEEVEESSEQPALIPTQDQEHHTELLYETASKFGSTLPAHSQNLSTPSVQAGGSAGRLWIIEPQNHVDLKIRILEDYQIQVLSTSVFKKYPAHQLQCPCGLQEEDFLNLLRSTFPQLAADQPFDTFITDKSKKLQPLKVKTLTPEEITGFIRSSGAGHSSLYIRLKELEEPRATDEELDPSQRKEAAADPPDETRPHTGVQPLKKKRRFRRQKETQTHIKLKIRVLEDSQIKKLTSNEFKKYPGHWLQCPRGLQEADFLHLLRSTFPQLASDQPFDILVTDKSRILQPLKVNTLTPGEIYAGIRSSGSGQSSLYIRLKELEEPRATDDVLDPSQRKEAAADPPDETRPHTGFLSLRVLPLTKKRLSCQNQTRTHVNLKIRFLDDCRIKRLAFSAFKKYPGHWLQCPRGLQEADFLHLLRSTFPQLAADRRFDILVTDKSRMLHPLKVNTLTPEEIYAGIRSSGAGHSSLYIQLKELEEPRATDEELDPSQRKEAAADPPDETRPHTGYLSPRVLLLKKKRLSCQNQTRTHVNLKIRFLDDCKIKKLAFSAFKKYPCHWLKCPRGLQEADFLYLLRSTFPQLATDQPFDIFITDKSRILQPLKVKTLTPEEIYAGIRSSGAGNSSLYIRLKELEELRATDEEFDPSQRKETSSDSPDETTPDMGLSSPRVYQTEPQTHIEIWVLEDSQIDALDLSVFQKYSAKELRFPCGLQEADFLNQLRSTFPQLAADRCFDVFTTDQSRKLQPLKVNALTPEELYRTIRTTGNSDLYIRLKKKDADDKDSLSTADQSTHGSRVQSDKRKPGRPPRFESQGYIDINIRLLDNLPTGALAGRGLSKYPVQQLQCPCGLKEAGFMDLLRSTFPQLAADFEILVLNKARKLIPLEVNEVTPEEIYRIMRAHGLSAVYVKLKDQEEAQASAEDPAKYSPSTSDEARLHSSISVQKEVDSTDDVSINSQLDTETEEAKGNDEESASFWSMFLSKSETDEAEENDGDHDWKPDNSDSYLRNGESEETTKRRRVKHSDVKTNRRKQIQLTDDGNAPLSCKVCRVLYKSTNKLIKHAWSHVYNPERRCGVCGEGSESAEELRSHLQGHLKTHSCSICGKSFLSTSGLKGHVARHKAETPYKCKTCHKAFTEKSALNNHKELHTQSHADEKLYSCSTCRKSFRRFETLSQHMASQSCLRQGGERTYVCEICNRHFYTNKKLQAHMSSHTSERQYTCRICNKQFPGKTHLVVHMRVHTG